MASSPLPDNHQRFLSWFHTHSGTTTNITPTLTPYSGIGILTTSSLPGPSHSKTVSRNRRKAPTTGLEIASCPARLLLHRESAPRFSPTCPTEAQDERIKSLSTHAYLALAIALELRRLARITEERGECAEELEKENFWYPWISTWPTLSDFRTSMPLLWPEAHQELLPPSALHFLYAQSRKYEKDWRDVTQILSSADLDRLDEPTYQHAWLIVNTRTLFYRPDTPAYEGRLRDDCMTLCPFIDYFNHTASADCKVEFSGSVPSSPVSPSDENGTRPGDGFTVTTAHEVPEVGREVYVSYGCHSNDFLLVEYGFLLDDNKWDDILLDPIITPIIGEKGRRKEVLEEEGFWGNYTMDKNGVCFRTQAAARMSLVPEGLAGIGGGSLEEGLVRRFRRFLSGEDGGEREQGMVDEVVRRWVAGLRRRGGEVLEDLGQTDVEKRYAMECVKRRWKQVLEICESVESELIK